VTEYLLRKKGLFWLTILEVSVYEQLVLFLWACGKKGFMADRKQRQRKNQGPHSPFKNIPSMT
jgi:hypothetical protein